MYSVEESVRQAMLCYAILQLYSTIQYVHKLCYVWLYSTVAYAKLWNSSLATYISTKRSKDHWTLAYVIVFIFCLIFALKTLSLLFLFGRSDWTAEQPEYLSYQYSEFQSLAGRSTRPDEVGHHRHRRTGQKQTKQSFNSDVWYIQSPLSITEMQVKSHLFRSEKRQIIFLWWTSTASFIIALELSPWAGCLPSFTEATTRSIPLKSHIKNPTCAVLHHYVFPQNIPRDKFPYERRPKSTAYIPFGEGDYYYTAAVWGGYLEEMYKLVK